MLINSEKNYEKILALSIMLISINGYAQSSGQSNIDIKANVTSGCLVNGDDFIYSEGWFQGENMDVETSGNLYLKCSKSTTVNIAQTGLVTAGEKTDIVNTMTLDGISGQPPYSYIKYIVRVDDANFISNEDVTITKRPASNILGTPTANQIGLVMKSSNEVTVPLYISMFDMTIAALHRVVRGTYKDTIRYTLTF